MGKYLRYFILTFSVFTIVYYFNNLQTNDNEPNKNERIRSSSSPKSGIEAKLGRAEYFNRMLRDPATGQIPKNIRQKELSFAKKLREETLNKNNQAENLEWNEAGPNNVGGRTRALAVDVTNSNTIIAGGVSGGVWKSTDKGETWQMKSTSTQILSVTSIAQDPRSGHTNIWYYGTGEFQGSAGDMAQSHIFSGDGIYKSIDNGETWNVLNATYSKNTTRWDSEFDYVYKIMVNPATGSIFVAVQSEGIFRSTDGGNSFSLVIGGSANHYTSDLDIHSNGTIVAVLSTSYNNVTPQNSPGVYKSTNDGNNWTNITPNSFPESHYRNLVEIAPSNPNVAYVLSFTWEFLEEKYDIVKFHKINISNGAAEDRSQNMPLFNKGASDKFEEWINTQNGYNLTLAVKPDDENFVMIAATSLFRSTDGFSTKLNNEIQDWIGGYNSITFMYPNFHSDIHSFAFEPNNPNAMWWGHDGGLSYTSNITNTSYTDFFPWENKNNGYNVTQFYMITISNSAGDDRILGGTQDNGSPYFKWGGGDPGSSYDASSGDGAYAYLGTNYAYSSAQNGRVLRLHYDNMNNIIPPFTGDESKTYKDITPAEASNQLFINPFTLDPNDENVMYYLGGNVIWRNNQLNSIEDDWQRGTTVGWTKLDGLTIPSGFVLSTLAISQSNPIHRLYYGASDQNQTPGSPKIYKLNNAKTASNGAVEISIPNTTSGSYVHHIAVNPSNADEIIVILSNYNILGAYHSLNGGQTYSAIEGNLEGDENNPGPSIRSATILPTNEGIRYFLATSTGVYSTTLLNGNNTIWNLEGAQTIGNVVVNYITSRNSDGRIVAGTHGRGAFVAEAGNIAGTAVANTDVNSLTLQVKPGETGSTSFNLKNDGTVPLNYSISVTGSFPGATNKQVSNSFMINVNRDKIIKSDRFNSRQISSNSKINSAVLGENFNRNFNNSINSHTSDNILYLDDGDSGADNVFGWASGGNDIYCYNEFYLGSQSFALDKIYFYLKTNQASSNDIYVGVFDEEINAVVEEYLSLPLAPTGDWFYFSLNSPIVFGAGEVFYIEIGSFSSIEKPIGVDIDAVVPNQSYYGDGFNYYNLNTVSGGENGAFLIRAGGTLGGGGTNLNPVAIASLSKTNAAVNESITFDASGSYDNDGQITSYLWNFGDGETSTQKIATHSYSTANSYNYTLKVTDNNGGTDQTNGQVNITGATNQYVIIDPANGSIAPGNSQKITLTLNAQAINEGSYTGQVTINSNGGTITIPIDYLVDIEKISSMPEKFSLSQNYPNPFNPNTSIEFSIPNSTNVSIKIYDLLGKEVATLLNEKKTAGTYKIIYEAAGLVSGVYIYRIETNEFINTKKLILLK